MWGSLISLGSKLLSMAMPLAEKTITTLATGASSGLARLGVDKIFGKGQRGCFLIQQDKIAQLIASNIYHLQARKRISSTLSSQAVDWLSDRREHSRVDFWELY